MSKDETVEFLKRIESLCLEIIARLDAAAPKPANLPDLYWITSVEHYISHSGNPTWKAFTAEGDIIYLRQANKDLLVQANLWNVLNAMSIGDTWDAGFSINAVQDGDFLKPMDIPPGGKIHVPDLGETLQADDIPFGTDDIIGKLKNAGDEL